MLGSTGTSSTQKSSESTPFRGLLLGRTIAESRTSSLSDNLVGSPVDDTLLLDAPWPDDLDLATVPFLKRSVTILRRVGYFDEWTLFNTLTGVEVLSWTMAGVGNVADITTTGNAAIVEYHGKSCRWDGPWLTLHRWSTSRGRDTSGMGSGGSRRTCRVRRLRTRSHVPRPARPASPGSSLTRPA